MATIVDHLGNPISSEQLAEPQTARLGQLHSEYENHPTRGLTPPRLAKILQDAEQGDLTAQHEMFKDMEEKDGHLFSVMQTRRQALQGVDWDLKPPPNASAAEIKDTEMVKEYIATLDLDDFLFDATDAVGHGFSALETKWDSLDGMRLPVTFTHRPQGWFKLNMMPGGDRNELRLRNNSAEGEALWQFGWVLHKHKSSSGYISRAGLFRVMTWPFLFKNFSVRDLAEFLEIYGLPLRLGTYGPGATATDKATLMRAVVGIGHDAAAIIPQGMAIDFKNAATGDNKSFDAMISLMERTMSKAALGGTLTSGEGEHGTQALGNVHNELRHDLLVSDARQVSATITKQLVFSILAVNRGLTDIRRCPRFVFDCEEAEDFTAFAESAPKLVAVGLRIPVKWAHDKLKIPMAAEGEPVLAVAQPDKVLPPEERPDTQAGDTPAPQARAKSLALLKATPTAELDELDALSAEMLDEWVDMDVLQAPVQAALKAATSFDDFSTILEDKLATADPAALVDLLARGTFAARMWGLLNAPKKPQ